ncbi:MAG: fasciclin domain-containing protein [Sediminibacterium sp.]
MKKLNVFLALLFATTLFSCNSSEAKEEKNEKSENIEAVGQSGVQDDASQKNVVQVAISSKDHSTLVTAIKAGELVDALSNAGPFTVFAPTNEAFNKLPAGTVEGLLKPASKESLVDILQYHVSVGVYKAEALKDGQNIGQVNGDNITITKKGTVLYVNGTAKIIASIPASNGIIHVIDGVLLPPKK